MTSLRLIAGNVAVLTTTARQRSVKVVYCQGEAYTHIYIYKYTANVKSVSYAGYTWNTVYIPTVRQYKEDVL